MLVAGCLLRAAGFLTLVLYAMNRRYWISDKGAFLESHGFRKRPPRFHATVPRVLGKPGGLNSAPTASAARRIAALEGALNFAPRRPARISILTTRTPRSTRCLRSFDASRSLQSIRVWGVRKVTRSLSFKFFTAQ